MNKDLELFYREFSKGVAEIDDKLCALAAAWEPSDRDDELTNKMTAAYNALQAIQSHCYKALDTPGWQTREQRAGIAYGETHITDAAVRADHMRRILEGPDYILE